MRKLQKTFLLSLMLSSMPLAVQAQLSLPQGAIAEWPTTIPASLPASSIIVGTTTVSGGSTGRVLYDNAGVLGELTTSGSGTVLCLRTSCAMVTPSLGVATGTSLALGGATIGTDALAVTGTATISGNAMFSSGFISLAGAGLAKDGGGILYASNSGATQYAQFNSLFLGIGTTSTIDTFISRHAAAGPQFGGADAALPIAQTLWFQNVATGTSNIAGANAIMNLSIGTGTGVGGNLTLNCAPHSTTGSTQNALSPCFTINGDTRAVAIPGVTTGTNADFACFAAGGIFTLQTTACTISSIRFKENIKAYSASALVSIMDLRTFTYRLKVTKPANKDPNTTTMQLGLTAENIAKIAPLCAIYENDMKTPKTYRQECVIALLVKGEQELKVANDNLQKQINLLKQIKHRK